MKKNNICIVILIICIIIYIIIIIHQQQSQSNKGNKVLTGIVCIDRDADVYPALYDSLLKNGVGDIMIVTRNSDQVTIDFWNNKSLVKTIPHYDISERHNIEAICIKRTLILEYAKNHKYEAIWFVDSDIIPTIGVLKEMMKTTKDICIAPYRVKWSGYSCVGIKTDIRPYISLHKINIIDWITPRKPFIIGGFGCTYVRSSAFNQKIENITIEDGNGKYSGEDFGFFINCSKSGLKCEYLTRWDQKHVYDRAVGKHVV